MGCTWNCTRAIADMRINGFKTKVVSVPRERGPLGEGVDTLASNFVTLRLTTDEGVEGIGYGGFVSSLMVKALKEAIDALAEQTIGENPVNNEAISAKLFALAGSGAPAGLVTRSISAIDVAVWDIKGKALGQPVYRLLGGHRDRVKTYYSGKLWRPYSLDELRESGIELVEQGFKSMKFRMGAEETAAKELASQILRNGALAVRLAKLNLNNSSRTGQDSALLLEQVSQAVLFESEDKRQRMTDFLERKKK